MNNLPKYYRDYPYNDEQWEVQIKGEKCTGSFEISVIRKNNEHGHKSYGWFDDDKLLICHDGGPCRFPLSAKVWDKMIKLAHEVADELNKEEIIL